MADDGGRQRGVSCICAVVAEMFGIVALVLMLVWLLHYRDGLNLNSHNPNRVFNVHPFLMFFGFMFFLAQALLTNDALVTTIIIPCRVIAMCLGIVGIHAAFKFHDMQKMKDMHSFHSWIGMVTFCLFFLQFVLDLVGLVGLLICVPVSDVVNEYSSRGGPAGRTLLYMATCAAATGLMEKAKYLDLDQSRSRESNIINTLGVAIILFGITVDISVVAASCARASRASA